MPKLIQKSGYLKAPEAYQAMARFVLDNMSDQAAERALDFRVELYQSADPDAVTEETVADAFGRMMSDSSVMEQFVRDDRTAAQKVMDFFRDLLREVRMFLRGEKGATLSREQRAEFRELEGRLSEMERVFSNALQKAGETVQGQKETAGETGGETKYSMEQKSIKDQLRENQSQIESMPLAARVTTPNGIQSWNMNQTRMWVMDQLRPFGFKVDVHGVGTVILDEKRLNTSLNYLQPGDAEVAAYAALPQVLKRGIKISEHENHKGRNYGTLTIAAPIELNGERGNMAVVIKQTNKNYYKMHRILTPDGRMFVLDMEDAGPTSGGGVTETGSLATPISSASDVSIPKTGEESKGKFSLKMDSQGRELSEAQREYFQDSQVRDADGRLKVMYRGDSDDFTVFDRKKSKSSNLYGRGFYFTDSENHASQYGDARAYYLNIRNPVPTQDKTITRGQLRKFLEYVAENEDDYSFENYGQGATVDSVLQSVYSGKSDFAMLQDVSATAIGDLVETVEIFNRLNGTDFDGLILDTETVIFQSNQAKNVDNLNPTENQDIRYSRKSKDYLAEIARKDEMIQHLKDQMKLTKGAKTDAGTVKRQAKAIAREYATEYDAGELGVRLQELYDFIANGTDQAGNELSWAPAYERAAGIARDILQNSRELNDDLYRQYSDLRKYLRDTKINIPQSMMGDLESVGGYNALRKANMGRMTLSSAAGVGVDQVYQELANRYPEFFDEQRTMHPTDQLLEIIDVLDWLRPTMENPYSADMESAVEYLAYDLIDRFYDIPQQRPTFADRQARKLPFPHGHHELEKGQWVEVEELHLSHRE